jgi:hypothetical protein
MAPFAHAAGMPAAPHAHHFAAHSGFCHSCCHPTTKCCCGCRECRKESKELLVEPTAGDILKERPDLVKAVRMKAALERMTEVIEVEAVGRPAEALAGIRGIGHAYIGGGCCVHLSVEYAPATLTARSAVEIMVMDSEGTEMTWGKYEMPGVGYQVKEGIITTKPGAKLVVVVSRMVARVRWCEVFSC